MKKTEIITEIRKHPFKKFHKYNDLIGLAICSDMFCEPDEESEFEELLFIVEKDWLVKYMNRENTEWDEKKIRRWLRETYTSYDSIQIYEAALEENAIVMIDFY